jgi:hypothetical protein
MASQMGLVSALPDAKRSALGFCQAGGGGARWTGRRSGCAPP